MIRKPLVWSSACLALWVLAAAGCASLGAGSGRARPLSVSELVDSASGARRASLLLVVEGLEEDAGTSSERAQSSYERAMQVDPTNPYAFLAVARHHADGARPVRALPFLDQAESLLRAEGMLTPGVEAHLVGLRGSVDYARGDIENGLAQLARARELAPVEWADGHLSARELL